MLCCASFLLFLPAFSTLLPPSRSSSFGSICACRICYTLTVYSELFFLSTTAGWPLPPSPLLILSLPTVLSAPVPTHPPLASGQHYVCAATRCLSPLSSPPSGATLSSVAPSPSSLLHPLRLVVCRPSQFRRRQPPSSRPSFTLLTHSPPPHSFLVFSPLARLPCCRAHHPRAPCCLLFDWCRSEDPLAAKLSSGSNRQRLTETAQHKPNNARYFSLPTVVFRPSSSSAYPHLRTFYPPPPRNALMSLSAS